MADEYDSYDFQGDTNPLTDLPTFNLDTDSYDFQGDTNPLTGLPTYDIDTDSYDFQGGTNPLTGLPVGSGEVGYSGGNSSLMSLAKSLGLTKDGGLDWSKILGLGGAAASLFGGAGEYNPRSAKDLLSMQPSNTPANWTPAQLTAMQTPLKAGNQLQRIAAADMPSPIRPGKGYAEGGPISPLMMGNNGPIDGPGGGQDDIVDIKAAPGEYIWDAETVSMFGDGDNDEGARRLDQLREAIRAHKRSAPPDEIAPRAESPLAYMKGGLNG